MTPEPVGKRCLYLRYAPNANHTRVTSQPNPQTRIVYDIDAPTVIDDYAAHAKQHGGKLLIPIGNRLTLSTLRTCSTILINVTGGQYLTGDIDFAGEKYKRGMNDRDGYTTPDTIINPTTPLWAKVSNVKTGTNLDLSGYRSNYIKGHRNPFAETINTLNFNVAVIYNLNED